MPIGRPRKKRRVNPDERVEKVMKVMVMNVKLSRKGKAVLVGNVVKRDIIK